MKTSKQLEAENKLLKSKLRKANKLVSLLNQYGEVHVGDAWWPGNSVAQFGQRFAALEKLVNR